MYGKCCAVSQVRMLPGASTHPMGRCNRVSGHRRASPASGEIQSPMLSHIFLMSYKSGQVVRRAGNGKRGVVGSIQALPTVNGCSTPAPIARSGHARAVLVCTALGIVYSPYAHRFRAQTALGLGLLPFVSLQHSRISRRKPTTSTAISLH